ncbi:hypothetical protein PVAND_017418 [Polypedilum vanderplanki]|uniref:Calcineurin-like phosphoesterase domain-containing protein n=1 Tax=Polypedilum vanderplanki TaxID=319348 RepID=A0A9J6BIZ7_POLVA|nr:hypothetical protein PVAND_017418 [Polypedilum vanderplanki]
MWHLRLITIFILIFFNEFLIYKLQSFFWSKIPCTENCTKILFIADPQILGNNHELLIARVDSDQHMKKNFKEVFKFVKPDLVIFLGDLMDEGSIASDRQFLDYYKRFLKIFPISRNETEVIFISGDNDIGGEGYEKVEIKNVKRFNAIFGNETNWSFGNLEIFHVDRIQMKIPEIKNEVEGLIKIIIGHCSILHHPDSTSRKALEKIKPNLIFSAHDHQSMLLTFNPASNFYPKIEKISSKIEIKFENESLKEIQIPVANYRMGTLTIGYGQAAITNDGVIYEPIFVLSRFYQFGIYFGFFIVYLFIICCWKILKKFWRIRKRRKNYRKLINEA